MAAAERHTGTPECQIAGAKIKRMHALSTTLLAFYRTDDTLYFIFITNCKVINYALYMCTHHVGAPYTQANAFASMLHLESVLSRGKPTFYQLCGALLKK